MKLTKNDEGRWMNLFNREGSGWPVYIITVTRNTVRYIHTDFSGGQTLRNNIHGQFIGSASREWVEKHVQEDLKRGAMFQGEL